MFCLLVVPGIAHAVELRIGLPLASGSKEWEFVLHAVEELAPLSAGKVGVQLVPVPNPETGIAAEIMGGKLDGALVTMKDFRQLQMGQDALAFAIPFTFKSVEELDYVRDKLGPEILRKLSSGPYEAVAFMGFNFSYVMSAQAIASPNDWRSRKIWISAERDFSDHLSASLDIIGLKTVTGLAGDVQRDLESGIIDTVIAPATVALIKRWHKLINNVFVIPFNYNYGLWLLRDDAMEKLSGVEKQAVREQLLRLGHYLNSAMRERNDKALDVMVRRGIGFDGLDGDMEKQLGVWTERIGGGLADEYRPSNDIEVKIRHHRDDFYLKRR